MRLGTADVLVRAKTDKFNKDIDKSEKKVKSFSISGKRSLSDLSKTFVSLAGPAGVAALTASLAGVIVIGAKFEKQMATVRGVMRANEKDFKRLSVAAKKMGATTEWSATQAAEALNYMGMAGWSVKDSIAALPDILNLATSGSLDLGRASDIVTDSLTAMGLGVQDLSRFNDILTGTFTRTNTTVEMIGETLKYVAPIASAMGYEIEELAAMLGTLAQSGIKASDAGTDLRQAFIKNASAAKVLGTEADDLIGTLEAAKEAGWGVAEMTKHYGLIALKSVLKLTDNLDLYKELAEQLHNVAGETKELADIKLDTLIGDFDILKSSIEGLGNTIYASVVTPIRWFVRLTTEDLAVMNDAVKAHATTWAALGLYSVGMVDLTTAILDGVNAVETYDEALGPEKLRLAFLERVIATGKYTSKVYWEAKKLRELIDALPDIDVAKTKKDKEEIEGKKDKKKKDIIVDDSWIKNMQAQEAFALKMSEAEQERLNKRYELEQEINAKIHNELLSNTENRLQELDKQFLAADSSMKDKAMLDEWYVKNYEEIMEAGKQKEIETIDEKKQAYMDLYNNFGILTQEAYDQTYETYVKDRDDFIALTGDKETAHQLFTERLTALNEEMEDSGKEPDEKIDDKSWIDGAKAGLESYAESANDTFINIKELTTSSLHGMEDALVDFCMTGKLNFKDLAKSIIKDLIKMAIQVAITNAIMGGMSLFKTPGAMPTPMGGAAAGGGQAMSITGSMTGGSKTTYLAKGGIFNSGLSSHSNTVIDSPTFFSFAKGQGLMGEAGPEAIMPLTRLPGGGLGVKTETNKADMPAMTVNIHEAPGAQARVEQSEDGQSLEVIIEQVEQSMQSRMNRGTGMAPFMDGRYGRAY